MDSAIPRSLLCVFALIAVLLLALGVCVGAESTRETAALALLREGEKLNEATNPGGALPIFEKVMNEYPDTTAAPFAELRRVETLVYLGLCDDALSSASLLQQAHPRTLVSCWAQYWIGEAYLKKQDRPRAARELLKVNDLLPDRSDLGPLEASRRLLGELCEGYLGGHRDVLDAADYLGLSRTDVKAKAQIYSILAMRRSRGGRIDLGNPVLDRLRAECPGEKVEQEWACAEVALSYLETAPINGEFCNMALDMVRPMLTEGVDAEAGKVCLSVAKFYKRNGRLAEAADVLKAGKDRFMSTCFGADVAYELGKALQKQGKFDEASAVFKELIAKKWDSRYVAAAKSLMNDSPARENSSVPGSLDALLREAEETFDPEWQKLTTSPKDGSLGTPTLLARQVVALAKDRDELFPVAFDLLAKLASEVHPSALDRARARNRLGLCFFRTALSRGEYWRDTAGFLPSLMLPPTPSNDPAIARASEEVLQAVVTALDEASHSEALPPDTKAMWLLWLGRSLYDSGRYRDSVRALKMATTVAGTPQSVQAEALYHLGASYRRISYNRSARRVMLSIVAHYPNSLWSRRAADTVSGWDAADAALVESRRGTP